MKRLVIVLAICIIPFGSTSAETSGEMDVHSILVVGKNPASKDTEEGIQSAIILIKPDGTQKSLGLTNEYGKYDSIPPISCKKGMELLVTPSSAWYLVTKKFMKCEDPEFVRLADAPKDPEEYSLAIINLAHNITVAHAAQDYALTALLYSDLAAEFSFINEEQYRQYSSRAVDFYALATDYPGIITQGKVLGGSWDDFTAFVRGRQAELDIAESGVLNYKTLSFEAGRNIHWFRNHRYEDISKAPSLGELIQCTRIESRMVENYLTEQSVIGNLMRIAKEKERMEKYGDATLLYNEVQARASYSKKLADFSAHAAFVNAGKTLGVESSVNCDPEQRKYVLTPAMVSALEKHQKEMGILLTGKLDYETIRSFSEFDVAEYLSSAQSVQGGAQR